MIDQVRLTKNEVKVVKGLLQGISFKEIRERHDMSSSNIHSTAARIYAKIPGNEVHIAYQLVVKYFTNEVEFVDQDGRFV